MRLRSITGDYFSGSSHPVSIASSSGGSLTPPAARPRAFGAPLCAGGAFDWRSGGFDCPFPGGLIDARFGCLEGLAGGGFSVAGGGREPRRSTGAGGRDPRRSAVCGGREPRLTWTLVSGTFATTALLTGEAPAAAARCSVRGKSGGPGTVDVRAILGAGAGGRGLTGGS